MFLFLSRTVVIKLLTTRPRPCFPLDGASTDGQSPRAFLAKVTKQKNSDPVDHNSRLIRLLSTRHSLISLSPSCRSPMMRQPPCYTLQFSQFVHESQGGGREEAKKRPPATVPSTIGSPRVVISVSWHCSSENTSASRVHRKKEEPPPGYLLP